MLCGCVFKLPSRSGTDPGSPLRALLFSARRSVQRDLFSHRFSNGVKHRHGSTRPIAGALAKKQEYNHPTRPPVPSHRPPQIRESDRSIPLSHGGPITHEGVSYKPPRAGVLTLLPQSWVPYAELMRLDKPAGTYYLFFPCLFSTLLAATYADIAFLPAFTTTALFFSGALIMRGAGCTVNDLWDRNLDPHVARTRLRPIARGAITPYRALVFLGFELLAGLTVLLQFPTPCLYYGIPSLVLVATYPLAKRVTHYPQLVLGFTFSWGAMMGFPALGIDLLADSAALQATAALYASCISWTVLYDMIYAHMDIKDDVKVGIKSIALRHEKNTKAVLCGLAVVQTSLLAAAGATIGVGPAFFLGTCGSAAANLGLMIWKVKLTEVSSCWWWFKNGALLTGGGIASGMFVEYMLKPHGNEHVAEVERQRC